MKKILLYLIFFFFACQLHAAKNIRVSGKIFSEGDFTVKLFAPILGYYNQASVPSISSQFTVTKDSFFYTFTSDTYDTYFFALSIIDNNTGLPIIGRINFLLCSGDSTHLLINPNIDNYEWITFSGDNATGNNLFQKINFNPAEKFKGLFTLIKNLPEEENNFLKNVLKEVNNFIDQFKSLLNQGNISLEYFESMKKTFMMSFYGVIVNQFDNTYEVTNRTSEIFRYNFIDALFQRLNPVKDPDIKTLYNSFVFINTYYKYQAIRQKGLPYVNLLVRDTVVLIKGTKYLIDENFNYLLFIKDLKIREDLWAINLLGAFQLAPGLYDERIIAQFDSIFPNSRYFNTLDRYFKETSEINNIEYSKQMPIIFADSQVNIKNIEGVLERFKGKAVYIDLWASWCSPCIASFTYNKKVDSFLLANSIERIYISLDDNKAKWKAAVNKYLLGGFHVLANESLIAALKELLGVKDGAEIGIPRYFIYDKGGNLITKDAYSPIDNQELFDELKKEVID